jgi:hypothetical protein
LVGTDIPDYFEIYDNPSSPNLGVRTTLRYEDCTPPDRVGIGRYQNMAAALWDFTPIPDMVVNDYGWAVWWNPVLLNPGESRTIVSYYGMAAASSSWTSTVGTSGAMVQEDPFCVAVQGPKSLPITYDAAQPAGGMLDSNPFKIKAYIYNLDRVTPLTSVNAHLTLPPGLELVTGNAMQPVSTIAPEKESVPVEWTVRANGTASGNLDYLVSVSGAPGLQKTVKRSILVPATNTTNFTTGWQMVSIPFNFADPRLESALGFAADTYEAFYWDTEVGEYRPTTTLTPGKAFWLNSSIDRAASVVANDGQPFGGTETKSIVLHTGWNQFGDPILYNIPWSTVKVLASVQVGPVSVAEAVARNWIRQTIYWYDVPTGEYKYSSDTSTTLVPWQGYWIKAMQPCQLIIPQVGDVTIGGGIGGNVTRSRRSGPALR